MAESYNPYAKKVVAARLLAADAARTIVSGIPGAKIVIHKLAWQVLVSAAQAVEVGIAAAAATKQALSLPASATGSGFIDYGSGFEIDEGNSFVAAPALAGPSIHFVVEYSIQFVRNT
jgi:hypothetical protein